MNADPHAHLRPLFNDLERALSDAGHARLAAWARLRHFLLGHASAERLPDHAQLLPMMWAARDESPGDPQILAGTVLRRPYPRVWEVAYNLWILPEGEPREAVRAILERITSITGEDLHPGTPRLHGELLKAVETLEQTLFEAGQLTAAAACVAFRLNVDRYWLNCWILGSTFRDWHALAGTPLCSWAWLCTGDASGLADQIRAAVFGLSAPHRDTVEAALVGLQIAAGLAPGTTGEERGQIRRAAVAQLLATTTMASPRTSLLIRAVQAALDGQADEARRLLEGRARLSRGKRLIEQSHVALADLPWLVSRVRRSIRGPEAHAALRALEAVSAPRGLVS